MSPKIDPVTNYRAAMAQHEAARRAEQAHTDRRKLQGSSVFGEYDPDATELRIERLAAEAALVEASALLNRDGADVDLVRAFLLTALHFARDAFADLEAGIPSAAPLVTSAGVAARAAALLEHASATDAAIARRRAVQVRIAAAFYAADEATDRLRSERKVAGLALASRVIPPLPAGAIPGSTFSVPTTADEAQAAIDIVEAQRRPPIKNGMTTLEGMINQERRSLADYRERMASLLAEDDAKAADQRRPGFVALQ